jgi:hypothetical protein
VTYHVAAPGRHRQPRRRRGQPRRGWQHYRAGLRHPLPRAAGLRAAGRARVRPARRQPPGRTLGRCALYRQCHMSYGTSGS